MLLWGNDVLGPGFWQAACGLERWNTEEKRLSPCFQMYAATITQDINACMQMVLSGSQNGSSQDLTTCRSVEENGGYRNKIGPKIQ